MIGIVVNVGDLDVIVCLVEEVKGIVGSKGLNILVCNVGVVWGFWFEDVLL